VEVFNPLNPLGVSSMHLRPLRDRIFVRCSKDVEQYSGGIVIPDSAREKPQRGTVVAVGDGKVTDDGVRLPLDVTVGSTVLFGRYAGYEVRLDGIDYTILKEDDVLAVTDEGPTVDAAAMSVVAVSRKRS
jgi:chaperonin GroES